MLRRLRGRPQAGGAEVTTTPASLNYELLGDLPIVEGMTPSHLFAQLWTPGYALAFTIPASLSIGYWRWRSFLNQLRRYDALGLDRRDGNDRRQAVRPTPVEHRRGERRRPPRYLRASTAAKHG